MSGNALNRRFLLLQALLVLFDCISFAYISPILVSLGYSDLRIGQVMAMGALASAVARPLWGILNDRFACARQVTLLATAVGSGCYALLTFSRGHLVQTTTAVMGIYVTVVCMMNFVDSWALRLIETGAKLNYGATRAGGSFSYAVGAMIFGAVVARWGFRPGIPVLLILWGLLCVVVCSIPNPPVPPSEARITLKRGICALIPNRFYWVMLAAMFLCTLATSTMEIFYPVFLLELGGSERHVGFAMFLQAMSELPVMIFYNRIRKQIKRPAAAIMAVAMMFYGFKALVFASTGSLAVAVSAALLQSLSFALFMPACVDFMLETVPGEYLATAHLLFLAFGQGVAAVVGSALGGMLSELCGIHTMFRIAAILAALAGVIAWHSTNIHGKKERL